MNEQPLTNEQCLAIIVAMLLVIVIVPDTIGATLAWWKKR